MVFRGPRRKSHDRRCFRTVKLTRRGRSMLVSRFFVSLVARSRANAGSLDPPIPLSGVRFSSNSICKQLFQRRTRLPGIGSSFKTWKSRLPTCLIYLPTLAMATSASELTTVAMKHDSSSGRLALGEQLYLGTAFASFISQFRICQAVND